MPPVVNKKNCIGCLRCTEICPLDVFGRQPKGAKYPVINHPEECWHCDACVLECPAKALRLRMPLQSSVIFVKEPLVKTDH